MVAFTYTQQLFEAGCLHETIEGTFELIQHEQTTYETREAHEKLVYFATLASENVIGRSCCNE